MCVCVCGYMYVPVCLCMCLCVCVHMYMSVSLCVYVWVTTFNQSCLNEHGWVIIYLSKSNLSLATPLSNVTPFPQQPLIASCSLGRDGTL